MGEFLKLVNYRQSDRSFDASRPVENEKLDRILEAARLAPSACNAQPWYFIVVDDPELKDEIANATSAKLLGMNHFTKQAPLHIIVVEEKANMSSKFGGWIKGKHFPQIDIGIVAAHICLAAEDEGLGSCILGWFDEPKIKKILRIPSDKKVVLDIVVGYSKQDKRDKKRKELTEIVSFNTYHNQM